MATKSSKKSFKGRNKRALGDALDALHCLHNIGTGLGDSKGAPTFSGITIHASIEASAGNVRDAIARIHLDNEAARSILRVGSSRLQDLCEFSDRTLNEDGFDAMVGAGVAIEGFTHKIALAIHVAATLNGDDFDWEDCYGPVWPIADSPVRIAFHEVEDQKKAGKAVANV